MLRWTFPSINSTVLVIVGVTKLIKGPVPFIHFITLFETTARAN